MVARPSYIPTTVHMGCLSPRPLNTCHLSFFFLTLHNCISFAKYQNETSHSNRCGVMSHCVLTCISPKISDIEHFKMYLLVICLSLEKFLFSSFKIRLFLLSHYKE